MKRCFGYVRVSTVKQGDGVSLEAQREAIAAFASRNAIEITEWFEEKETAAKKGRPIFNRMVAALRRGKAEGLVIHKIDRSARNFADWAKIGDLADAGFDIHFATESLDFRSRGGRLTADIQAVIAADYVRNLREETIKGITGRLKQGLYPFKAPIGYLDNGGGMPKTLDPLRAPLVRRAFELYGGGRYALRSLLHELERLGLRNDRGKPLSLHGLETLLANSFYCGIIHIKRTGATYKGVHERLIPVRLFDRVQALKSGKAGPKVTRHEHAYRGLFRCGLCDRPMVPERQKGYVYYRCHGSSCPTKTVREDRLAEAIERCLAHTTLGPREVAQLKEMIDRWIAGKDDDEAESALALRTGNLRDRIDRLTDALVDRLIDKETFAERRKRLALEEEAIEQERATLENQARRVAQMHSLVELAKSLVQSHRLADPHEKHQLVELAISNRYVFDKELDLKPSEWLQSLKAAAAVPNGDPDRHKDRTDTDKPLDS
jgi:DNA invertase Pin-like site-specific DNA recombinase